MIDSLESAQVIFLGEEHQNTAIRQLQIQMIQSLLNSFDKKNKKNWALALEVLDRSKQKLLDEYLQGKTDYSEWIETIHKEIPRYEIDHAPLIELARSKNLKVLAMDAPRPILRKVLRKGKSALDELNLEERNQIAQNFDFEDPVYQKYFEASLPKNHPNLGKNLLLASIIRDETMAESILKALNQKSHVISINGRFHSDFFLAIPRKLQKKTQKELLMKKASIKEIFIKKISMKVVSFIPIQATDLAIEPAKKLLKQKRADFIIFVSSSVNHQKKKIYSPIIGE